jgi:hypothetical protein
MTEEVVDGGWRGGRDEEKERKNEREQTKTEKDRERQRKLLCYDRPAFLRKNARSLEGKSGTSL